MKVTESDRRTMLAARIRRARVAKRLNQTDFAELGGVGVTSQQQYEAGKTAPSVDYFFKLEKHDVIIDLFSDRDDEEASVALEEIDLAYGLGGTFNDGPIEIQSHRFPRLWVESITRTPPSLLTIAKGRGDSMMPTVLDGDMIIIDRSQRSVREQDGIWAITIGEISMVKRLRVRGDRVQILSDNDRVPADEAYFEEVNVVGRVIFIGHRT